MENPMPLDALKQARADIINLVETATEKLNEMGAVVDPAERTYRIYVERIDKAIAALSQPPAVAVTEGWPTAKMVAAGAEEVANYYDDGSDQKHREVARFAFKAMVSAAPPAPQAEAETQATIAAWADSVFGQSQGPVPPLLRAINELVEACIAASISVADIHRRVESEFARQMKKGATADPAALPSEVAGTVIVLYRVAQAAGFDLHQAVDAEMRKNRGRQWFAKGDGTGHHLPAPPQGAEKARRDAAQEGRK